MCCKQLRVFAIILMVVCTQGVVFAVNSPPTVVSATPASGIVAINTWKTITCIYSDTNGAANLVTCNLLINGSVANVGGAHFVYNRSTNKFYIKNNSGTVIPTSGVVRGTATTIESENAVLDCAGTTVTTSGNTLTIVWKFKVKSTMAGKNCNLYMTDVDASTATSGWIDKGDIRVNAPPTVVSATPASGIVAVNTWKTLTCIYSDTNGATDLATCNLLINTSVSNVCGAHFVYNRSTNKLHIKNNSGTVIPTSGVVRGTATTIESENAVLDCGGTTVTTSGNTLTIAWKFKVKSTMAGKNCNLYMTAADSLGSTSGWIDKGDLSINSLNVAPTVISATPASGIVAVGAWKTLTCIYSDPNGATDLSLCYLLINNSLSASGGAYLIYNRSANTLSMKNNAGTVTGVVTRGTATTIESENAVLDCAGTTVTTSGNNLTVAWRFKVKSSLGGKNCNLYMLATDRWASSCSWLSKGTINFSNPAPTIITTFTPASGSAGTTVTITGTNFTGTTAVRFNAIAATSFTVVSATSITAIVPVNPTTGKITVTTPGGTATSVASFTVVSASPGQMISIPAGTFLMGNSGVGNDAVYGRNDEFPQHSVTLAAYSIGKYEVTRGEYRAFMTATGRTQPYHWDAVQNWNTGSFTQTDSYPVVDVTYYDAEAFCAWAGGHLPTEAQWEKAARWTGTRPNVYPWGDSWNDEYCNNAYDSNPAGGGYAKYQTAPVGSYPGDTSPYGCKDMAGNVWEWCQDWYKSYPGSSNPFDHTNSFRVLRGGGFYSYGYGDNYYRCASRIYDLYPYGYLSVSGGFRLVR